MSITKSPLGKSSEYIAEYNSNLLFPIPRKIKRDEIGVPERLPFFGSDIWNGFEISWLNKKGKPKVAVAEFIFPCESPNIIESKSFKLYLNSFNNTQFDSIDTVANIMQVDLSKATSCEVTVNLKLVSDCHLAIEKFVGMNLDLQDIYCDTYEVNPSFLTVENQHIEETVFSDLLKSNCLVTGQPDWASILIEYSGMKINHENLLKYIISFRNHNEFHEQCVERIFMDIMKHCKPERLSVYARYTRRGGLDINPYRSTEKSFFPANFRLARQ